MTTVDYKTAGVDIAAGNEAVTRIKNAVESTFNPNVLTQVGAFGAMYDLKTLLNEYDHPVMVQSIDGVGTKMMVATRCNQFDTIGRDLVSATANDIVVLGAKPITLLDYIANDKLYPHIIEKIVGGMAAACRENDIALVGGETAEMPGTYLPGEHDLVGIVTGVVDKHKAILGDKIAVGDVVLGLPSSGLHTNGYSLARKLFFDVGGYDVDSHIDDLHESVGETLLTPHVNYCRPILDILKQDIAVHGMAHITGGGLLENVPRILPHGTAVEIELSQCPRLPVFKVLCDLGKLGQSESYKTFNMGVGMVLIVPEASVAKIQAIASDAKVIGQVVMGEKTVRLL